MTRVPPSDIFTRRVCLRLRGMDDVIVRRDIPFGPADRGLRFDVYHPPRETNVGQWPAVIVVAGYPEAPERGPSELSYKATGWAVSMCQLIASSGMAAMAYTNREPVTDLHLLFEHVHAHAESLRIDPARVGVMAVSGNVSTALATIMRESSRTPACAVFGYGCLLDLDGATDVAEAARQFGFANPSAGRTFADLRHDVPLFITRAGRDEFPAMNASIDRFIGHALAENLPVTLVNYSDGQHGFDLIDDSLQSRNIVRQTLRFLAQHLVAEARAKARD